MTLRHLKIFVAVCKSKGITSAAKKLHIAQPSVSLAIKELEVYYGVRLFDRISKKIYITETGKQFLSYAQHIVSLFDELEKGFKNWDTIGTLRIGTSITIGNFLLPEYVKMFQELHPQIKVHAIIDNSAVIEEHIISNDVDFALIEGTVHNNNIITKKFMEDELVFICGANHPLAARDCIEVEELRKYEFILREKGSGGRELFESTMYIHNIEIKPICESISTQAIIRAVSEGYGLSVLPYLMVRNALRSGIIKKIEIKDISLNRQYYIIRHKNKFLTPAASDFIKLCEIPVF